MVPAAIVTDISFTFCGDDPPIAPMRCIAAITTNTEFPEVYAFGVSDIPPTWKKFREYKSGTRWIRWQNWSSKFNPKFCYTFSEDRKVMYASFYRSSEDVKKQWLYPSIPTPEHTKPPFVLSPPIEVTWPELADASDLCDEIVDCSTLTIVNEDGSPATDTVPTGGSLDFKTIGACCGAIVWSVDKGSITQGGVLTANCCPCGTIHVTASCPGCESSAEHDVSVTGECPPITIVNENGSPATDTILKGGSLDFKTIGACCGAIVWSVSGTGGTITQGGVLTAGPTACGSLLVTASCPLCGTSDTQYVRITDAGKWVLKSETYSCNVPGGYIFSCISGDTKTNTTYFQYKACPPAACTSYDDGAGGECLPMGCSYITPPTGCTLKSGTPLTGYCTYRKKVGLYKWQC